MAQDARFHVESLLFSSTPEQQVLIAFSMLDVEVVSSALSKSMSSSLNWPWIVMQSMHHRTLALMWDSMKRLDLVSAATKSGLTKNWLAYLDQLASASAARNEAWATKMEEIHLAFNEHEIDLICIKGAALIDDIFTRDQRMLGDVDSLIRRADRHRARKLLAQLGFQTGVIDPIRKVIVPISREKLIFWNLYAHIMPKFTLPLPSPSCPFLRFAIGFDLFDPGSTLRYASEEMIARSIQKSPKSQMRVPDTVDTLIYLAVHIFREATSATMGYAGDNWNLWKFCDFRSKLLRSHHEEIGPELARRLTDSNLQHAFFHALHYTKKVYGDCELDVWKNYVPRYEDQSFLTQITDGTKTVQYDREFAEQLFDTSRVVVAGLEPTWSKVMDDAEWW